MRIPHHVAVVGFVVVEWVRRFIRRVVRWSVVQDESNFIEIRTLRGTQKVIASGTAGLQLVVQYPDGSERLLSCRDAVDDDRFWVLWKRFGPNLKWADGTPYDPKTQNSA